MKIIYIKLFTMKIEHFVCGVQIRVQVASTKFTNL